MTGSAAETGELAAKFAKSLAEGQNSQSSSKSQTAALVGLYGDLGSGKTSFMQGFGSGLGVSEIMVSPTFVIEKIYKLQSSRFSHLIHVDAYRIEKEDELLHLGWEELIGDPKNLICIEWPENVSKIMPADHIKINFTFIDENTRAIEIENHEI